MGKQAQDWMLLCSNALFVMLAALGD
jgi:hypothetical protein